jgi:hypothetical protein
MFASCLAERGGVRSAVGDNEETTARLLGAFPEDGSSGIVPATKPRTFLRGGVFLTAGGRSYALRAPRIVIGRSQHCRVVLDDRRVSHQHAAIQVTPHDVMLEDLGSVNGTWLNGVRLTETQALRDRDLIVVGVQQLSVSALPSEVDTLRGRPSVSSERIVTDSAGGRAGALRTLGRRAARKLAEGDVAGAEAALRDELMMLLVRAYGGQPIPEPVCVAATKQALSLALELRAPRWVNYVLELHLRAGLPKAPDVMRLLVEALSGIRDLDTALVVEYLELLEGSSAGGEERWLSIVLRSLLR